MRFGSRLTSGFFGGAALSSLVPELYMCSLNGRPYMIDLQARYAQQKFTQETIALLRNQADNSATPSEASVNPEDLWRRSMESWHKGAGQSHFDRPESDPFRFRSSKGVDVFTKYELSLLNDTVNRRSSSATNLAVLQVGGYLYVVDGTEVYWTSDLAVAGTAAVIQAGESAQSVKSICSDGKTVYAALGSNGIHTTTRGAVSSTHYSALSATLVDYVKGRLMAANGNAIYNVVASGAAPSALLSHSNTDFAWVGFAAGPAAIYAAGYSGDKSLVYRTAVKADGTALDAPVVAGELPDGEVVRAIEGYLGFLLLGTDKGWRLVELDANGDFATMSDNIPTTSPVLCFEPQDHFVWFGLSNYDGVSSGLGRADLGVFTKGINPAYASDVMASGQGSVLSAATFGTSRVFAVSGVGIFSESSSKVPVGTLDSGPITYGLSDPKIAMSLDVAHEPLAYGGHAAYLSVDLGSFALIGQHAAGGVEGRFPCGQKPGEKFEVRLELDRDGTDSTEGPTLTRATLFSEPSPPRSYQLNVPLLLNEWDGLDQQELPRDVKADLDDIAGCVAGNHMVAFQTGDRAVAVFVKDYQFEFTSLTSDRKAWNGVCTVLLKVPAGA